ncbi:MAG: SusC/RagA family TonB-linked outer membrane protein [Rhizobacter sp.]|nr:SusC/RagA family TonB-linked outer membrane protein [Ferruginibacter sp.]
MRSINNFLALLLCFLLCSVQVAVAQTRQISGTVQDDKGTPLAGASVTAGSASTSTDRSGQFSLTVPDAAQSIIITNVGFATQQLSITGVSTVSVKLVSNAQVLTDVVIIGYGSVRKKELTGSVAIVGSKDFQKGTITTPEQLIAGKVAGVSVVSNSGSPGAGSTIRIRGGASLNAANDPLIVIDGVPITTTNIYGASNPLSMVNPNDIETFTVLKDAASTAIYGSRASNGVILITTKKGTSGKPVFNFSTTASVSNIAKRADVMNADQFRSYVDSMGTQPFKDLLGDANTDWQKEIYTSALTTDNNLSVSGSLKNLPYRVSVGYLNQDGILRTDNLQRFSGGLSLSPTLLNKSLKVDINIKGAMNKSRFANGGAVSNAIYFDPTQPIHDTNAFGNYWEWFSTDPVSGAITINKLAPKNPVAMLDLYRNQSEVYRSYGNIQMDYRFPFIPDLHANVNLGYDVAKGDGTIDVPAYAAQNYLDSGQKNKYSNKVDNKVGELYFNYNKTFKNIRSNINATAGYGYYNNLATNYNFAQFRANGNMIPGSGQKNAFDKPRNVLISYYGRMIYTYDTKYIFAASIRTDGSSRFAPENRWGTFYSGAFTWRINQEKFLAQSKTLSDLKLRLSYGVTGNQDGIYNYPYQSVYSLSDSSSFVQFGNTWIPMGTPAAFDESIKWEQTSNLNVGIDFGFFNNRLSGSIDVYAKKTKDLLNEITVPAGSNFNTRLLTNVGNIKNKGIELTLNATPVQGKHFRWDVSFNAAFNDNEITNLTATKDTASPGTQVNNNVQIHSVGYSPFSYFVYKQQYDQAGKPIEGVYVDQNSDGIINTDDLYHYKSPVPDYILGFSTQFTYDRWSLSTVLRAAIGNYNYNGLATGALQSNVFNSLGYLANTLDEVNKSGFYYGQQLSDYFVQNASFLKMDNLALSYDFGKLMNQKLALRLTASCQNVFTVTKYTGIDPEINGGMDFAIYPRPRIFSLNANIQF